MRALEGQRAAAIVAVVVLGAVAWSGRWLASNRQMLRESRAGARIYVTSAADHGAGSLREAIFTADRADRPATIVLRTERIVLESELPPFVNPHGVHLDASESHTAIDAHQLAGGPVLQILSPDSVVEGLRIEGAAGAGVLVRASRVQLRDLAITDCAEGVTLSDGAANVVLEDSRLEGNGAGLNIPQAISGVIVRRNSFARHDQAGIRAISPDPSAAGAGIVVRSNRFEDDRISLVLINLGGRVEQNEFRGAHEAAVFVMGRGVVVRENRMHEGAGLGIFADATEDGLIELNELDHNAAIGLLLRSGGGTLARGNRVYQNGYGIAIVFGTERRPHVVRDNLLLDQTQDAVYVVGASPLVWENRALHSRLAAIRILDFVPLQGPTQPAAPLLADNVFEGNLLNAPVRGSYRAEPPKSEGRP
jgi:hypothetical protein